jgi:hypothetical protein
LKELKVTTKIPTLEGIPDSWPSSYVTEVVMKMKLSGPKTLK